MATIRKRTNYYGYKKSQGKYRVEHRKIATEMLGRDISPQEVVHHIDLDKLNNDKENLYVCNKNEHTSIHQQLNKVAGQLVKVGIIKFENGRYFSDFVKPTL